MRTTVKKRLIKEVASCSSPSSCDLSTHDLLIRSSVCQQCCYARVLLSSSAPADDFIAIVWPLSYTKTIYWYIRIRILIRRERKKRWTALIDFIFEEFFDFSKDSLKALGSSPCGRGGESSIAKTKTFRRRSFLLTEVREEPELGTEFTWIGRTGIRPGIKVPFLPRSLELMLTRRSSQQRGWT